MAMDGSHPAEPQHHPLFLPVDQINTSNQFITRDGKWHDLRLLQFSTAIELPTVQVGTCRVDSLRLPPSFG